MKCGYLVVYPCLFKVGQPIFVQLGLPCLNGLESAKAAGETGLSISIMARAINAVFVILDEEEFEYAIRTENGSCIQEAHQGQSSVLVEVRSRI